MVRTPLFHSGNTGSNPVKNNFKINTMNKLFWYDSFVLRQTYFSDPVSFIMEGILQYYLRLILPYKETLSKSVDRQRVVYT